VNITAVESSTLSAVAYDEDRGILQLEFRSRAIYLYYDVPSAVHEGLIGAASKGRYFNGAIRGQYRYLPAVDKRGGGPGEEA
jgi:hypothetical protein